MLQAQSNPTQPLIPDFIRRSSSLSRVLTALTIACAAIAVLGLFGVFADPRQVLGQPVWAKTTKFAISFGLYGAAMLWILGTIRTRAARIVAGGIGLILGLEMSLLITQAIRGRAMHFNVATPLDATLWSIMGTGIFVFWGFALAAAILMLPHKLGSPAFTLSLRLGLVIVLIGFTQGFLMTSPNALQQAALQSGQKLELIGAHTVNALRDGGPGIPFLGWSTDHGDLRIGHFVGTHAIQLIPLLGFFLMRRRERWLTEAHRAGIVWVGAFGYLGLMVLLTWQALRDQSIIAPDALTFTAFLGLGAFVLASSAAILIHARATART